MRKAANLTQEQLAQKIHNKQEYISRIESGKSDIRLSTLLKILHILNFKLQAVKQEGSYYWTCVIGAVFKSHEFRELHESKLV